MLQQMSEATLTLLLTMLALGAVIRFMPAAGRGRRGKKARSLAVWAGIGLGMVSSLALTIINVEAPKSVNRQTVGLFTLPVGILLAVLFLALIAVRSRRVRALLPGDADDEARAASSMETAVSGDTLVRIVGALYIAAALFRAVPTAMNQAVMMLSGGVEIYSTPVVLALVGYTLAWVLVCFVAWVSYRLCSWNNRVWPAAFILIALLANHSLMVVRILKAKRWISTSKETWAVMSWFINHEAVFTIAAGLALCAVVVLTWLASRSIPTVGANPAEGRLGRARSRLYKSMAGTAALGYLCGALLITVGVAYGSQEIELSPPESFSVVDDQVSVNLADISDGHLHRFEYTTSGGVKVRFIVIQKSGSSFGVGLDACEICGPSGYYEKDGKVICKLCEVAMNIATIGFKGGCNPIPIDYKVSNGTLTVPISALEASASIFAK
ncbi:DUF2318 domain-containing protein [Schaalia odontolytica]|uniref:Membrane iron-sulfur containing protein FtrD-like domain-containing protein n=1 Tax=Schaalia odontolytica TaxID=1660 RepID=A0A0V8RZM0_9ACTO|nr:DUF2318 domain-containing protein [Schaalia odontolytica]KSW13517.1 hypothetical protein APY09_04020 [Schaalia odontolytica]QCT34805.1 DUF2318 domain-containing protein [Schaalia odontolytica]